MSGRGANSFVYTAPVRVCAGSRFLQSATDPALHPNPADAMRPLALRTVLVATDLSDASLPAVRAAAELARLAGARLHAVYAADEPDAEAGRSLAVHLRAAGIDPGRLAGSSVKRGPAHRAVAECAERLRADAVVLGPHRPAPEGRPGIGSTADRVVRTAGIPCLVVPGAFPLPLGRVLAPVDFSAAARGSLLVALTWASALRRRVRGDGATELCVLHVAEPDEESPDEARAALHDEVEAVCSRAAGFAGVRVREAVEGGDAAEGILRHAASDAPDLLVLGTRGQGADGGDLLGSVSSAVVRRAAWPILLVPPAVWREYGNDPPLRARTAP